MILLLSTTVPMWLCPSCSMTVSFLLVKLLIVKPSRTVLPFQCVVCCRCHILLFSKTYKMQLGLSENIEMFSVYFYHLTKCSSDLTNSFLVFIAFLDRIRTFMEIGFLYRN